MPTPEVEVATVETRDVPCMANGGNLDGYVNAEIRPQVAGYIIKQNYTEVRSSARASAVRNRSKTFQATRDRAKGDLAQAQAQTGQKHPRRRTRHAACRGPSHRKSQLDNEVQAKLGAQAAVESAKAAVEQAELNLEWTKVISLVDGIAGIAQVQIGTCRAQLHFDSVSQVDPIKVFFSDYRTRVFLAQSKSNTGSATHHQFLSETRSN